MYITVITGNSSMRVCASVCHLCAECSSTDCRGNKNVFRQWQWLENTLNNSEADFNLIVSSIQFLSTEHGYETWGNMPHEVNKLKSLIGTSKAKGVIILSGDRHISEFSKTAIEGVDYPLIDFTSSGMTHSYSNFGGEPNQYRKGKVVSDLSFGLLKINFEAKKVIMQMRGENNVLQQELIQTY